MKRLKFVLSLITSDNDYQREQASTAEATARRLGVDVQVMYADSDAITQSQQLLKIIQDPSSDVDGSVLYIQGPSGSAVSQQRTSGMLDTKPINISLKTLKSTTWTEESGHRAVSAWLRLSTSHTERVDAVVAHNDFIALGARKAFEQNTVGKEQARWLSLPFLGVDGLPKTGQAWVRERVLTATIVVPPNTVPALEMLVEAIRTRSQPSEYTLIAPKSFPDLESLVAASGGS